MFEIQTQFDGGQWSAEIGEPNAFDTETEAWKTIEQLKRLDRDDWAAADPPYLKFRPRYRVREIASETRTYSRTEDSISALDLIAERDAHHGTTRTGRIQVFIDGCPAPEQADYLYVPDAGRLGIAWGADATWADTPDLDAGIRTWLTDPDAWELAN